MSKYVKKEELQKAILYTLFSAVSIFITLIQIKEIDKLNNLYHHTSNNLTHIWIFMLFGSLVLLIYTLTRWIEVFDEND